LTKEVTEFKDFMKVLDMIIKLEKIITEIKVVLDMIAQIEKEIKQAKTKIKSKSVFSKDIKLWGGCFNL